MAVPNIPKPVIAIKCKHKCTNQEKKEKMQASTNHNTTPRHQDTKKEQEILQQEGRNHSPYKLCGKPPRPFSTTQTRIKTLYLIESWKIVFNSCLSCNPSTYLEKYDERSQLILDQNRARDEKRNTIENPHPRAYKAGARECQSLK